MKFSIITTSFNPGEKLMFTIKSILDQDFRDFEIVVKDGASKDRTPEKLQQDKRAGQAIAEQKLKLIIKEDRNVYDGMNQALEVCQGEYILFLNCGDRFHDRKVLAKAAEEIDKRNNAMYADRFHGAFRTGNHRIYLLPEYSVPSILLL